MYGTGYPQDPYSGAPGFGYGGYGAPAGPKRPSSPKVLGILSIVFGSIVSVMSLWGLVGSRGMLSIYDEMPGGTDAIERFMESTATVSLVNGLLFTAMSIALIVIGVMQLKYKRVAVKASVAWGAAALVVLAVTVVLQLVVVNPAMKQLAEDMAGSFRELGGMMGSMGTIGAIGSIFFYSPYPIILLIMFTRPKVQEAMVN